MLSSKFLPIILTFWKYVQMILYLPWSYLRGQQGEYLQAGYLEQFSLFQNVIFFHILPLILLKICCFEANISIVLKWNWIHFNFRNETENHLSWIYISSVPFLGVSYRTLYIKFWDSVLSVIWELLVTAMIRGL